MLIDTPISLGELVDKISILIIKDENIDDLDKKNHVNKELSFLKETLKKYIKEGYMPFICSDDSDLLYKLKKEYDIIIHDHLDNNIEYTKEQRDFIDILLLGFCDIFVGSFLSSFSELVYYFSNDIQKTIII